MPMANSKAFDYYCFEFGPTVSSPLGHVLAEILLTLSLCGGVVRKVIFTSNPTKVMLG